MAVTTFYPDPHTESTSFDGNGYFLGADWAATRSSSVFTNQQDSSASHDSFWQLRTNFIARTFLLFDSSSIDDTDTIDSGILSQKLFYNDGADSNSDQFLTLVSSNPASNTALVSGDFDLVGSTRFATDVEITSSDTSKKYFDFTLNANGLLNVSKTSISKFAIIFAKDFDNSDPGADKIRCQTYFAEGTGTTDDPKLVVTHSVVIPPSGSPIFFRGGFSGG